MRLLTYRLPSGATSGGQQVPAMLQLGRTLSDQDAVLLCYEDVHKEGVWCHRQIFAAWWQEQTGKVVSELT